MDLEPGDNSELKYKLDKYRPRPYLEGTLTLLLCVFMIIFLIYYIFFSA